MSPNPRIVIRGQHGASTPPVVGALGRDLAYALRLAAKRPGFSAAVALTLALGIGGNTAVFSIINSVVLRPLPYPESEQLYTLFEQDSLGTARQLASYPTFLDWHQQAEAFDGLAFVRGTGLSYDTGDHAGLLLAAFVSEDFFPTLGVAPLRGRGILADDYLVGDNSAAVLSHNTWQSAFGADPRIVGHAVRLGNTSFTVVGVMPETFAYPNWGAADTDVWLPMTALPPPDMAALHQRDYHADSRIVARLAPDTPVATAQRQMDAIARRLADAYPQASARWTRVSMEPLRDFTVGDMSTRLFMMGGAVGVVLLICCVNLANLYLAQGVARRQEFAIRAALGAGRRRVLRQLLAEGLVVTVLGGVLGTVFATWVVQLVRSRASARFPRASEIGMDLRVLAFAAGLTVLTALLFATVSARRVASPHLAASLGERGGVAQSRLGLGRLPAGLLAGQVALTVVLLVGAALLVQGFVRLSRVNPGFDPNRLVLTVIQPPSPAYDEPQAAALLYARLVESVATVSGVERVALINHAPVGGGGLPSRAAIGHAPTGSSDDLPVLYQVVSAGYFSTMGIPMVEGREFTDEDLRGPPGPLIVSAALARAWGDRSPVHDRLGVLKAARTRADFGEPLLGTVVGVAGDVKHFGLDAAPVPIVYVPYTHNVWPQITLVARTAVLPEQVVRPIENAIRLVDRAIPMDGPGLGATTMERRVRRAYAAERLNAGLVSTFALAALLLAAIGIYGVTSYTVTLQTREIGIRMALGATPAGVRRAVVRRVAVVTVIGLAGGVAGALALTRLITGLLYQVEPTDPATFVGVTLVLLFVATMAGYLPARRAAGVDPVIALRTG